MSAPVMESFGLMTAEEAAPLLGLKPGTLRRYAQQGVCPHHKLAGNQLRFTHSDLEEFVEASRVPAKRPPRRVEAALERAEKAEAERRAEEEDPLVSVMGLSRRSAQHHRRAAAARKRAAKG